MYPVNSSLITFESSQNESKIDENSLPLTVTLKRVTTRNHHPTLQQTEKRVWEKYKINAISLISHAINQGRAQIDYIIEHALTEGNERLLKENIDIWDKSNDFLLELQQLTYRNQKDFEKLENCKHKILISLHSLAIRILLHTYPYIELFKAPLTHSLNYDKIQQELSHPEGFLIKVMLTFWETYNEALDTITPEDLALVYWALIDPQVVIPMRNALSSHAYMACVIENTRLVIDGILSEKDQ